MALLRLVGSGALAIFASQASTAENRPVAISHEKCFAAFAKNRLGGHEWRPQGDVLRVRKVRGKLTNEVSGWPEGTRVIFQTFGPATRPVVRTAIAKPDGAFHIDGVPSGEYCFEASADGWDPVEGLLDVSNKHPIGATIALSLPLAQ